MSQLHPQALRFSHGRGARETRMTGDEPQGTVGRVHMSPSRLPLRTHFHRERDVWVRCRACHIWSRTSLHHRGLFVSLLFLSGYPAGASAEERGAETPSHELLIVMSNGNRTEWGPIWSVIIRVINKIGRPRSGSPICLSTSMIRD